MEMIGGLAGAAGSIVSGILGARAADRAANMNWTINLMNYYQRERERHDTMQRADTLREEEKLGGSDIRGTRTQFIPGRGWVVTASPQVAEMMKLQDQAQKDILTKDIPMRRKVMERNYARGIADEAMADMFRRQLQNTRQGTDEAYQADLFNAMTQGLRQGSQDASRRIWTQAMRTQQNSNFDDIARELARAETEAYSRAGLNAKLQSKGRAEAEYTARRGNLAQLYGMFASRAAQVPDINYKQMALGEGETDAFSKQALAAGQEAVKAAGMKGGTLDYVQPNYGWANAVGGGASALASALRMGGASMRRGGSGAAGGGQTEGGVTGFGSTSGNQGTWQSPSSSFDMGGGSPGGFLSYEATSYY